VVHLVKKIARPEQVCQMHIRCIACFESQSCAVIMQSFDAASMKRCLGQCCDKHLACSEQNNEAAQS